MTNATIQANGAETIAAAAAAAAAMEEVQGEMIYVPLSKLVHSPFNVRTEQTSDVAELAALIDANGLLQNLVVIVHETKRGKATDKFGVVAGGRRRRALLLLVSQGKLSADEEILCKLTTKERAVQASASENSGREQMSTADTVMAFRAMVEAGGSIEDVAIAFGVSPLTVQRRLKLANVSPTLFQLFREGEIDVDQLTALAISDDHAAQERVWETTSIYYRDAGNLRRLLLGAGIDASRDMSARFVGLDAYEAAGGEVKRDLFSESNTGYMMDAELLQRLAVAKLDAHAEEVRAEAWGWVEARPTFTYADRNAFSMAPLTCRKPTKKEQSQLDALNAERDALDAKIQAAYDSDEEQDGSVEGNQMEADDARVEVLEEEIDAISRALSEWAPEVKATAGAVVTIESGGKVAVYRGLVRKADRKDAAKAAAAVNAASASHGDGEASESAASESAAADVSAASAAEAKGYAESMVRRLTAHRTKALQLMLSQNTHVALAALAHALLQQLVVQGVYVPVSALKVRANGCDSELTSSADDMEASPAWIELSSELDNLREHIPGDPAALLPWLIGQSQDRLLELLAMCAALSINAVQSTERSHESDALAAAVGLDVAEYWKPTADSMLASVPKAKLVEAVTEAVSEEAALPLLKMKKPEAVAQAETLLAGTRWLPSPLRLRNAK